MDTAPGSASGSSIGSRVPGLTVAVLVLNEVDRLEAALRSASFADERLVLDCGSTDGSVELAESLGARVLRTDWPGFAAQRRRALAEARHDHVFFLDADEVIDPVLAEALRHERRPGRVLRHNRWLGREIRRGSLGPTRILRLVPREARCTDEGVHERLEVDGEAVELPGRLLHDPYRSLGEHLDAIDRYSRLFAEHSRRRAWPWDPLLRPLLQFVKSYLLQGGLLEGLPGLALALLGSAYTALKWGRLLRRRLRGR